MSIKSSPFVCQKNPNVKFYYKVLSYLLQAVIVIPVNYFIGEIDEPFIPVPAQGTDCVPVSYTHLTLPTNDQV